MSFLIGAVRAIVEMLGLCLIAQAALYVLAGKGRQGNPVYRLFQLITRAPRSQVARCLPRSESRPALVGVLTFVILLILWVLLAWVRRFI